MQKSGTNELEMRRRNNGKLGNTGREVGGDKCMVPFCPISAVHLTAIFARFEHGVNITLVTVLYRFLPLFYVFHESGLLDETSMKPDRWSQLSSRTKIVIFC